MTNIKFKLKKDIVADGLYSDNSIFEWDPLVVYPKGSLVFKATDIADVLNSAVFFKSLKTNNKGNNPTTPSSIYWEIIKLKPSDISELIPTIEEEVKKQLDTLPTIENIVFSKNIWYPLKNETTLNEIITKYKLTNYDYFVCAEKDILSHGVTGVYDGDGLINNQNLPNTPDILLGFGEKIISGSTSIGTSRSHLALGNESTSIPSQFYTQSNPLDYQLPFKPKTREAYFVMFTKNIIQKGIVKEGTGGKTYNGIAPIIVDNIKDTIDIDLSNVPKLNEKNIFTTTNSFEYGTFETASMYNMREAPECITNKEYVDKNISKLNGSLDTINITLEVNGENINQNTSNIATNTGAIKGNTSDIISNTKLISDNKDNLDLTNIQVKTNVDNIEILKEQNKKQLNFTGAYDSSIVYNKNDVVSSVSVFYLSEIDNNDKPLNDTSAWIIFIPSGDIDLTDYYTKIEANNLLLPLEKRLTIGENDIRSNTGSIAWLNNEIFDKASLTKDNVFTGVTNTFENTKTFNSINKYGSLENVSSAEISLVNKMYVDNSQLFQDKKIDSNKIEIDTNTKNIEQLILENKSQINFLGTYDKAKTYMKNDSVVEKDIYYISIIDNNKKPLSDTSAWFKTSPSVSIDLSNYYTKIETNNLLLPLEKRLNDIDIDSANQQIEIDTNKNNISLRYTKDETLNMLNQKLNSSYFDSTIRDYQKKLTAGKNITIDNNNVISATGGSEEVWENVSIQNTTQGFNILNIGNYKKIRIVSMDFLKIYTNIESDYMGSAISSNTIYLDENINQNIPLTTNESSPYCVGGYLLITSSGVCNFNVRFYKNGNFGNSSINSYVGTIKVKGVKK